MNGSTLGRVNLCILICRSREFASDASCFGAPFVYMQSVTFRRVPSRVSRPGWCTHRTLSYTVRRLQDAAKPDNKPNDPLQLVTNDIREEFGSKKRDELSQLSRPLGVRDRPRIFKKTRTQRIKELMEHDARMEQRKHLCVSLFAVRSLVDLYVYRIKEASTGYFHDLNMTRRHGGKTWIAPKVLIRENVRSKVDE